VISKDELAPTWGGEGRTRTELSVSEIREGSREEKITSANHLANLFEKGAWKYQPPRNRFLSRGEGSANVRREGTCHAIIFGKKSFRKGGLENKQKT